MVSVAARSNDHPQTQGAAALREGERGRGGEREKERGMVTLAPPDAKEAGGGGGGEAGYYGNHVSPLPLHSMVLPEPITVVMTERGTDRKRERERKRERMCVCVCVCISK